MWSEYELATTSIVPVPSTSTGWRSVYLVDVPTICAVTDEEATAPPS